MKHLTTISILAICLLVSCKKEGTTEFNTSVKAPLSIEFDHIVGGSNLLLSTGTYTNAGGQNFTITKVKYYVSNFKLTKADGSVYTLPQAESYFLIDEGITASRTPVLNVPEGEYKTLSFVVGVDSLRNTADVSQRTGVLDVSGAATDMYWSWNSGYIFFKLDGTSPAITAMGGVFQYHVGGFGGYSTPTVNNLRTVTLDLTARGTPKVKTGRTANLHLLVDVLKLLNGSSVNFATTAMIHSPAAGTVIADNLGSMFTHDHTEN